MGGNSNLDLIMIYSVCCRIYMTILYIFIYMHTHIYRQSDVEGTDMMLCFLDCGSNQRRPREQSGELTGILYFPFSIFNFHFLYQEFLNDFFLLLLRLID